MTTAQRISIFDVDRTLTRLPTYSLFLLYAARQIAPWRLLLIPALAPDALRYRFGGATRQRLKESMHALLLGRRLPRSTAEHIAAAFAQQLASDGTYPQARALIRSEIAEGRRVILATAAPMLYIAPFAKLLGVEDVVATRGSWSDDHLTHRIDGDNCYADAKLAMLQAFVAANGIDRENADIRFYSDHASDLPTFDWVDEPVAVNPSSRLRKIAVDQRWRILDWKA